MPVRILSSADQRWVNLEGIRNQQKYAHMFLSSAGVASQAVLQLLTAKGTYLSLGKSVAFSEDDTIGDGSSRLLDPLAPLKSS